MNSPLVIAGVEIPGTLRTFSREFVLAYVTTMRPYLMFVSGITGIAGLSRSNLTDVAQQLLVAAAAFLSYGFGQALTDCFQTDTDRISSPYRPLTRGVITKSQVLGVSIPGLAFCVGTFGVLNPLNYFLGVLAGLGLATYTPLKRRWWGGPFYNAWIVTVLCCMAMLTVPGPVTPATIWMLTTVFFGYANFVLSGYFKDIDADRATGYNTFAVVFGRSRAALVSDAFALASCIAASAVVFGAAVPWDTPAYIALAFAGAGVVAAVVGQVRLHRVRTDRGAHRAIAPVVHSYILLLSAISVVERTEWVPAVLLFYAAFVAVMSRRPEKSQI